MYDYNNLHEFINIWVKFNLDSEDDDDAAMYHDHNF